MVNIIAIVSIVFMSFIGLSSMVYEYSGIITLVCIWSIAGVAKYYFEVMKSWKQ